MASRCPLSISASIPSITRYGEFWCQAACTFRPESRLVTAMDTPTHDVIIVGAGPAGLIAATEAARAGLKCLALDKLAPGGLLINLGELHDFDEIFSGTQMASL